MTALYEKVGIKYRVSPVPYALRHFDTHMLLIAATRYFIGRMTIATCSFAQEELAKAWPQIPQKTRDIIRRDLEEAFRDDDRDREEGASRYTLGWDCDRKAWEAVRTAWQTDPVQPASAPTAEDAPSISPLSIADRLEALSEQMLNIAAEMDYFGGFGEMATHGKELAGAAYCAKTWAGGIREDFEADAEYRISAEKWGEILGVCEGTRPVPAEQPVNARLLEAAKAVLRNKRGEDDWLILSVDCLALEAAISAAEAQQIKPQAKGD